MCTIGMRMILFSNCVKLSKFKIIRHWEKLSGFAELRRQRYQPLKQHQHGMLVVWRVNFAWYTYVIDREWAKKEAINSKENKKKPQYYKKNVVCDSIESPEWISICFLIKRMNSIFVTQFVAFSVEMQRKLNNFVT